MPPPANDNFANRIFLSGLGIAEAELLKRSCVQNLLNRLQLGEVVAAARSCPATN